LLAREEGKAVRIGRGPATVIGKSPKARLPSQAAPEPALREKELGLKPHGTRSGLFISADQPSRQRGFVPQLRSHRKSPRTSRLIESAARVAGLALIFAAGANAQSVPAPVPGTDPAAQSQAIPPPAFREVVDETGRTVRIAQPVRRIVSLAPNITETLYALGLQDLLAGDTDYCDYPPDAKLKPKVGGAINPSLESIANLHPDLVLVTKSLNRLETVRSLDHLGIPSYATDPHTVQDIISSMERLAEILGAQQAGATLAQEMERRLAEIEQRVAPVPASRVLFVVWREPLISVGTGTFIADALRVAGAKSIIDSAQSWPQVNLEEVVRQQPDFLVFAESHPPSSTPESLDVLSDLPGWRILTAVQNRRYAIVSDAVDRPSPRIVSAIENLAKQLHPEAFEEKSSPAAKPDNPSVPAEPATPPSQPSPPAPPRLLACHQTKSQDRACAL
jgi:iron complex transport system substrate-binding protein